MTNEDKILEMLEGMSTEIKGVSKEVSDIRTQLNENSNKLEKNSKRLNENSKKLNENSEKIDTIIRVDANYDILKALEDRTDTHFAEIENIKTTLAKTEGDIVRNKKNIKSNNNRVNLALNNAAQNRVDFAELINK